MARAEGHETITVHSYEDLDEQITKKVIEEAKTAKILLRKAALKSYVTSEEERLFLRRIFVLLTDIKLSLLHIHSEPFGVKNLALFDLTNTILR